MEPKVLDFRTNKTPDNSAVPPSVQGVWEDKDFTPEVAFYFNRSQWKRVTEIRKNPVLFTKGASRFDIGQGELGTCWFLAMVANVPKHEHIMEKVLKEGDYDREKGVVHCRFWNFGKWEDVYIDDHLAVVGDTEIWGARSVTNENEMWVSFLEKAYAKFNGSYGNIYGGWPSTAYLALAGGIAEEVLLHTLDEPMTLFRRVKSALRNEGLITCCAFNRRHGLLAPHAYTLIAAKTVTRFDGRREHLLRIRNPYGKTEWTGPWGDGSDDWKYISEDAIRVKEKDDGEFWISVEDLFKYFQQITICSLTPDFDEDGYTDSLSNVLNIYGQWLGKTAAGAKSKFQNPKFLFTVPEEGTLEDGSAQLVFQLIQKVKNVRDHKVAMRCDMYKVLHKETNNRSRYLLELVSKDVNTYSREIQLVFRHKVKPGQYVVIPSTRYDHLEKEFMIRIFAASPVENCSEISEDALVIASDVQMDLYRNGFNLTKCSTYFGAWVPGFNAGGPLSSEKSHHLNPQFDLTIPDAGIIPVGFHLLYSKEMERHGARLYLIFLQGKYQELPVNYDYIKGEIPKSEEWSCVSDWRLEVMYCLRKGRYMVCLFTDTPDVKGEFALHVKSSVPLNMSGYQTGADKL